MTKRTSILSKIYLAVTVLLAIAATTLRVYMMQNAFDPENGFYTNDALHNIFGYSLAAVVILVAVIAYIYKGRKVLGFAPRRRTFEVDFPARRLRTLWLYRIRIC